MMNEILQNKYQFLKKLIRNYNSAIIAYSGGIDSTFLTYISYQILGKKAIAITTYSPSLTQKEIYEAKQIASQIGIHHILLESHEFNNQLYLENSSLRCFFCKKEKLNKIDIFAKNNNMDVILDGSNYDDLSEDRPGRKALDLFNIHSPLIEATLTKKEIRELARYMELPNWDKPSNSCLSTRIPQGIPLTIQSLQQVDKAENHINKYNVKKVRVRHHGDIAHIEVQSINKAIILENENSITQYFKTIGFEKTEFSFLP
jgi:pyridinium-3,5-biscarboxylic acid mononucleotide sulfurtransferase